MNTKLATHWYFTDTRWRSINILVTNTKNTMFSYICTFKLPFEVHNGLLILTIQNKHDKISKVMIHDELSDLQSFFIISSLYRNHSLVQFQQFYLLQSLGHFCRLRKSFNFCGSEGLTCQCIPNRNYCFCKWTDWTFFAGNKLKTSTGI